MDIYGYAARFRRDILRGERRAAAELVQAYGGAWQRIRRELDQLTKQSAEARARGEDVSAAWLFRQGRLETLQQQVQTEMRQFALQANGAIQGTQRQAVTLALAHSEQLTLAGLGGPPPGVQVQFTRLPVGAVEDLVGFLGNGSPLRTLLDTFGPVASEKLREALVSGLALGRGPREIAREVREHLGGNLTRALTIARTEVLRAYRTASIRSYAENDDVVREWQWVAALNGRTCAACIAMHGQRFPLSVPFGSHPNCRCTAIPVTKSWDEILGEGSGIPDTRPEIEGGPAWFARQERATQLAILGPAKLKGYEAGDFGLVDLVGYRKHPEWGPTRWERSLKDVRDRDDGQDSPSETPVPVPKQPTSPAPTLRPSGPPVSGALRLPPARKEWREALQQLDSVHGDGQLPQIPVKTNHSAKRHGAYASNRFTGEPIEISIRRPGDHEELTLLHETGHFLDHQAMGLKGSFASEGAVALEAWRKAVDASQVAKALRTLQGQTTVQVNGLPHLIWQTHVKYLLTKRELWARSYAQYIAVRSGNKKLVEQLDRIRGEPVYGVRHWSDDDFEPIAAAIDALFRTLGWLKK